ncbi:MAG: alpha-amylase family glycosyl hydrolase, partial [Saprospiraceae bacterium]
GGTNTSAAKNVVYVVGDFNNWTPSEAYKLNRDTVINGVNDRGDYWWITLEGLTPGQEYVFQYLIDGSIRVADPYSFKISDPDDHQISSAIYPGLISYRSQAVDRASVLQTNKQQYNWTAPPFTKPTTDRLNIYELHFRDFTEEGTYLAAISKLDYIKGLGINAIHVMPVSEFEGNSSWGYNPNFYFAADKAYGTENDLKLFIDECHKRQIQVFNDVVLNHAFYSNVMAKMYWNTAENKPANDNPWFNSNHKMVRNPGGHWGADWNHESEHVQTMVDSILGYWLKEFKFDGFRFDFTKGFGQTDPNDFPSGDDWASSYNLDRIDLLKRMVNRMWNVYPGSVAIFEHLANSDEDRVLANHGILMWSGVGHHNDLKRFILGYPNDDTNIYESGIYSTASRFFSKKNWMSYGESHDEERLGYELMQYFNGTKSTAIMIDRLKIAYGFNLFLPGTRMLWQFGELGYEVSINYNGRTGEKPVRWNYYDEPKRRELYRFISYIFQIRNKYNIYSTFADGNVGLVDGNIDLGANNLDKPRIMRLSSDQGKHAIIIANLHTTSSYAVPVYYDVTGTWYKYNGSSAIDGKTLQVSNISSSYTLEPSETILLTNFPLDICTNVTNSSNDGDFSLRYALECAMDGETITLDNVIPSSTINITEPLILNKNITIRGLQGADINIDGSMINNQSLFQIMAGKSITIENVDVNCSQGNINGRCLLNNGGNIILKDVEFIDSTSNTSGNSVYNSAGTIDVQNNLTIKRQ